MSDEAVKSLSDFPAKVIQLPTPGIIYTDLKPNPSFGYQIQFQLEEFFSILATHELSEELLKNICAWTHPRPINSKSLQLGPRHWHCCKSFTGDSNVDLGWRTAG